MEIIHIIVDLFVDIVRLLETGLGSLVDFGSSLLSSSPDPAPVDPAPVDPPVDPIVTE